MDTKIVPVTDFIRSFKDYADLLPSLDKIILTKEGRPVMELRSTPVEKNKRLLGKVGSWKDTDLDDDVFWKKVLVRKSRKSIPTL